MAFRQIGSFRWSNPNHAVNLRERMRHNALHNYARRGEYERHWTIAQASFEPWREGEYRDVLLVE